MKIPSPDKFILFNASEKILTSYFICQTKCNQTSVTSTKLKPCLNYGPQLWYFLYLYLKGKFLRKPYLSVVRYEYEENLSNIVKNI